MSFPRSYISDITTSQCRQLLKKEAAGSLFDVVLHDGAPNVGGAWASEAYTQVSLTGGGGGAGLGVGGSGREGAGGTRVLWAYDSHAIARQCS